jgi:glycerol-3-phosphate acyltransferase PlsY
VRAATAQLWCCPAAAGCLEALVLDILISVVCMVIGYLLGTIPTGYLVARARGVDIQKRGSGNIGATNVLRSVGTLPALMVMVVDPLKGALAILFPMLIGVSAWGVALTGLATVLGNNFNVFLGLRGGKGVATSLGVFMVVSPLATLLATFLALLTIALGRYVSLGSIIGMTAAPLLLLASVSFPMPYLYLGLTMALLAIVRHRENLVRLAAGTERRLGEQPSPPAEPPPPPEDAAATRDSP